MGSIAKVRGFKAASQPSQLGMNDNGAKAVLANSNGRLATKITAINSMCPGKAKASPRLRAVTAKTRSSSVTSTKARPLMPGHP